MNHYEALGVPVGAGAAEIRQAYLSAARRHHPDFHVDADAATRARHARQMVLVNEAWEVLGQAGARERYDLSLRLPVGPPTERIRPNREPDVPAGKGWTPRRGDDGWQRDFAGWAAEDERLAPEGSGIRARKHRGLLAIVPVAVFALGILSGFLGMVLSSRELLAGAFIGIAVSAALFVMLPIIEMSRGRHRD
ncbi:J domain-containing protein [Aquihabitans sp. G128]|uniref:J domain-containing protein n=1 Tax=Aquihabitans sp. G128 TaxID=2849779 RepID=UPI001C250960|nr:J domain-containing protein [Aquihabitans sp. G128]QXC62549.1 J domain-containing protein [Aquihabitans sp. G128]